MVIDGRKIAEEIISDLKTMPQPGKFFGAALVGDDPSSLNFLKQKERVAKELGIDFRLYQLPVTMTTDNLRREIARLAGAKTCGGFIVQLPLPEGVNRHYALNAIPKEKDVDTLGERALGAFYTDRSPIAPPSVGTVEELLKTREGKLRETAVAVIGAGFLIGKPVGFWLQNRVAELMVFDASVKNLEDKLGDTDIVISGAGHPDLFGAKHLKNGTLVIDFGFNPSTSSGQGRKVVGDFDPAGAEEKSVSYTPTPGGTGPILVAKLFENFYKLNSL